MTKIAIFTLSVSTLLLVACGLEIYTAGSDTESGGVGTTSQGGGDGWEVRDVEIPGSLHVQGLSVPGKLFVPTSGGAHAGVLVLHGSGGLFEKSSSDSPGDPCSPTMEQQFVRWGERLVQLGYVVLMPASFNARGFCDYNEDGDRIPDDFDDERERLVGRLYDADAATRFLCGVPEVDCDRLGVLGFSNGASVALLLLHWQLERALTAFALSDGEDLQIPVKAPPAGRPALRLGVAYYPGCSLQEVVTLSTEPESERKDMYFPTSELHIEHGGDDGLVSDCSVEYGEGRREIQAGLVAESEQVVNLYQVTVHVDANHEFDNAESDDNSDDVKARDAALASTLAFFSERLGGS